MAMTYKGGGFLLADMLTRGHFLALGLSGHPPTAAGTGMQEPSGANGYARVDVSALVGAPQNNQVKNNSAIYFPENLVSDWGEVRYYALYTAAVGGDMILWGEFSVPVSITVGHTAVFRENNLTISIS